MTRTGCGGEVVEPVDLICGEFDGVRAEFSSTVATHLVPGIEALSSLCANRAAWILRSWSTWVGLLYKATFLRNA